MEGLSCERFGDVARLPGVAPHHQDPSVVVLHGESPVVLGPSHLTGVLPWQYELPRDVPGLRKRPPREARGRTRIDDHSGPIATQHLSNSRELDLAYPAQCPPDRNAELVAPDVPVTGRHELRRQALALAAVGTVAVEHDRGPEVALQQAPDFSHIRDVGRRRHPRLRGHVQRTGDMTDGVFRVGTGIEHSGAAIAEHAGQLVRGDLGRDLPGLAEHGVPDRRARLGLQAGTGQERRPGEQNGR